MYNNIFTSNIHFSGAALATKPEKIDISGAALATKPEKNRYFRGTRGDPHHPLNASVDGNSVSESGK